jgi:hypothetical protein
MLFYTYGGCHEKQTISVAKDVEKLEPSYIAGGNREWHSHLAK